MMELIGAIIAFFLLNWIIGILVGIVFILFVGFFVLFAVAYIGKVLSDAADEKGKGGRHESKN